MRGAFGTELGRQHPLQAPHGPWENWQEWEQVKIIVPFEDEVAEVWGLASEPPGGLIFMVSVLLPLR